MTSPPVYDPARYPPFAVTVDIVVFTVRDRDLHVALVERGGDPFAGARALPGGFVEPHEDLLSAARRELAEETGLRSPPADLEQLGAYGDPDRDPRMRVVTVAYWAIAPDLPEPRAGGDAGAVELTPVDEALNDPDDLAFDHREILNDALERVRDALETTTLAVSLCPPEFTVDQLRGTYEAIWDQPLDPDCFRRRVTQIPGLLEETGRSHHGRDSGPDKLFRAGPARKIDPPIRRPTTS